MENTQQSESARSVTLCGNFTTNGGLRRCRPPERKMNFLKSKAVLIKAMSGL